MDDIILEDVISTLNNLIQIFKRGPGYKKFPLEGTIKYSKHPATMFISSGGQGLMHCTVVESCIEKLYVLIERLHDR